MKRRPISQLLADGLEQCQICQPVATSLQEEHWHLDLGQMAGPPNISSPWSMQGKSEKDQPLDPGQAGLGCQQRRHAPAHGFTSCQEAEFRRRFGGGGNRRLDRCQKGPLGIRKALATFPIGKLIAKRGNVYFEQGRSD